MQLKSTTFSFLVILQIVSIMPTCSHCLRGYDSFGASQTEKRPVNQQLHMPNNDLLILENLLFISSDYPTVHVLKMDAVSRLSIRCLTCESNGMDLSRNLQGANRSVDLENSSILKLNWFSLVLV